MNLSSGGGGGNRTRFATDQKHGESDSETPQNLSCQPDAEAEPDESARNPHTTSQKSRATGVQRVSTPDILRELVQRWEELSRGDQDEITNLAERKLLDSKTKIDANRPISTQDHLESESTEQ